MATFNQEIIKFANGNEDTVKYFDRARDWMCHRFSVDGRKIGEYDASKTLAEKSDKLNQAFFAEVERMSGFPITADNAQAWHMNPSVQWAAMAIRDMTINSLLPITTFPNMDTFVDLRILGLGDIAKFKVTSRDLFVVSQGANGERTSFRQKAYNGDVIVAPREHIITVFSDWYTVMANREDIGEYLRKCIISIETVMGQDAITSLNNGLAEGTYPSTLSFSGAFDAFKLITLAETVEAANYGARPIIMGTATALAKVLPDSTAGFRGVFQADGGSVEIMKNFYGFDLVRMRQFLTATPGSLKLALDPNTLYAISPGADKLIKGAVINTISNVNQHFDNADLTSNNTLRKSWGFDFVSAARAGKYKITD